MTQTEYLEWEIKFLKSTEEDPEYRYIFNTVQSLMAEFALSLKAFNEDNS